MINVLKKIKRVSIELSNLCSYSSIHKKCPLSLVKTPIILSKEIVFHVIDFLAENSYSGKISFHTYNEPGIDPRLFLFIKYAREKCPQSYIFIMSSGYYVDENLINEYKEVGLDEIMISAYTESEYKRFTSYKTKLKFTINKSRLDDRLDIYQRKNLNLQKACHAPLNELMVTREGYIGLCCLDWKREVVFGNLHKDTLINILKNENLLKTYEELSHGIRLNNICKRCDWSR